nr:methyltransferase domain-containing protein [Kibdelosporangium sp. MJ126-NF4]CEL13093.1 ribosomal RNA adenine dimethylase domain protein [Kibdelosporangium sp. MJ126-NF4]CTQ98780.1 ribosomal RNA adenine dimethylase domain protein [Kibdelosporangium sp. MJ126-NF4]
MRSEKTLFLREFLKNPRRTAAVLPSGQRVARNMAMAVPGTGDPVVVELGPGTGAFTAEIQRRLGRRGRHLAVELNDRFAALLRARFPAVDVLVDDALNLRELLNQRGLDRVDVIVSGLPNALFTQAEQRRLLDVARDCLAPDGNFAAFAYVHLAWTPPTRRFSRLIDETFGDVTVGKIVWAGFPPAFVYIAGRIRPATSAARSGRAATQQFRRQ